MLFAHSSGSKHNDFLQIEHKIFNHGENGKSAQFHTVEKKTVNTLRMVYTGQKVCFFAPLSPGKYPNYKNSEFGEELVVQISRPPFERRDGAREQINHQNRNRVSGIL